LAVGLHDDVVRIRQPIPALQEIFHQIGAMPAQFVDGRAGAMGEGDAQSSGA
jgi:hypothetical protein